MIQSATYSVQHPALRPFVQYILFNKTPVKNASATSFSNNNICVGILKNSELVKRSDGKLSNREFDGITTYLSGMYLHPHTFVSGYELDEICIDFTPLGFYHFFSFAQKKYILGEDILSENFGQASSYSMENVFNKDCIKARGVLLEKFLLQHMKPYKNDFLNASLHIIHNTDVPSIPLLLDQLRCSERKLQRTFQQAFDISPKQYLRIHRFRKTLLDLATKPSGIYMTDTAYARGYSDQSHMIKEVRAFTGNSPSQLVKVLQNIDKKVIVAQGMAVASGD